MNARVSFLVRPFSVAACAFLVGGVALLSGDYPDSAELFHQPTTFDQMQRLVMPQDPLVEQALQEALSTISTIGNAGNLSDSVADLFRIRIWITSNITGTSDYDTQGVSDYWQTPSETLTLRTGDCEDFAILMVSMLRAYGVAPDEVYVAVGYDLNNNWHAFVVERYCYGVWTEFNADTLSDAQALDGDYVLPYRISYCFNDRGGFYGTPGYPKGYAVPPVSMVPIGTALSVQRMIRVFDNAKQLLGELWMLAYLPEGYTFYSSNFSSYSGKWFVTFVYAAGVGKYLFLEERLVEPGMTLEKLVPSKRVAVTVNNQPAYIYPPQATSPSTSIYLAFIQGSVYVRISGYPTSSWTGEELIRIAESLAEY